MRTESVDGSERLVETSSSQAKQRIPIAAGQRPSFSGYAIGSGRESPATRPDTQPTARPTARHGLKSANTSPSSTCSGSSPTQNST